MAPWIPFWKLLGYWLYLALYFVVCEAMWDYPAEVIRTVFFKALPILHLCFIILSSDIVCKDYTRYKWNILFGLAFSMLGDACLVWRVRLFLPGLMFFAFTHFFYIRAFGLTPFGGGPTATSCVIVAGCGFLSFAPSIHEGPLMYVLVTLYTFLIFTMMWRSVVCLQTWPSRGTFCACVGAILFSVSDFLIALDKWRFTLDGAALYIMVTYFLAQLFVALSAACYTTRKPVKYD